MVLIVGNKFIPPKILSPKCMAPNVMVNNVVNENKEIASLLDTIDRNTR